MITRAKHVTKTVPGRGQAQGASQGRLRKTNRALNSGGGWRWFWRFGQSRKEPSESLRGRRVRRRRLEAILFIAREPLNSRKLAQLADLKNGTEARTLIRRLNQHYQRTGRAFRVEQIAGGFQLLTRPQFAGWLRRLHDQNQGAGLSTPALETLAVVAYRQPILRAEIESVRGVSCGELLRQLMDRNLVRISGRSEDLGRPFLYSTTRHFLTTFGLNSLDDLPRAEAMRKSTSEDDPNPVVVDNAADAQNVANPSEEDAQVTVTELRPNGLKDLKDPEDPDRLVVLEIEDEENYAFEEGDELDEDELDDDDDYEEYDDDEEEDDEDFDEEESDEEEDQWEEVEDDSDDEDDEDYDDDEDDFDDVDDEEDYEDDDAWDDEEEGEWDEEDDDEEDEDDEEWE